MAEWITVRELMRRLGIKSPNTIKRYGFPRRPRPNPGRGPKYEYEWARCYQVWRSRHPSRTPLSWYEPSDEALWLWRDISLIALSKHLRCNRKTLMQHLGERGWQWRPNAWQPGVREAPCSGCGLPTERGELNVHRECRDCRENLCGGNLGRGHPAGAGQPDPADRRAARGASA